MACCSGQTCAPSQDIVSISGISDGIYTGTINEVQSGTDGTGASTSQTIQTSTTIIIHDGKFADPDGTPREAGDTYTIPMGSATMRFYIKNVGYSDNGVVANHDVTLNIDGEVLTGTMQLILTRSSSNSLNYSRTVILGGYDENGPIHVSFNDTGVLYK